LGHFT